MPHAVELGVTSVLDVVEKIYNIEGKHQSKQEYLFQCPNPGHNDRNPSCSVNLETGYWLCFSCGVKGDLVRLGQIILGKEREEILELFQPYGTEALLAILQRKWDASVCYLSRNKPAIFGGPYKDGPLTELKRRGFTDETLKKWGIRYVPKEKIKSKNKAHTIIHNYAIPVRDRSGTLLFWIYRKTEKSGSWQKRYLYSPNALIRDIWFGTQFHGSTDEIAVCEGALDAIWLDQAGVPALAMLGSNASREKVEHLKRFRKVILFMDNDAAGIRAATQVGDFLDNNVACMVASYEGLDGKDPQELSSFDIEMAIARAEPFWKWRKSN